VFEALPAKERECRKEMWMFTMWFGGITQRASAFSAGTASSRTGRCSDKTRPFFADSHWEAEPFVPFLQQPVPTFASYELSTGGFRPSHRTTLCSLSVKFRRAPHGPETQRHSWHRTVLQQPGSGPVITSYLQTRSCRHQSTIYRTVTSGFPLLYHSGSLSSSTSDRGHRMGIPPIWID